MRQRTTLNPLVLVVVCGIAFTTLGSRSSVAQVPTVEELLPATAVAFAEISNPGEIIEQILNHPIRARLEALPAYQHLQNEPNYKQARGALALFEAGMGQRWPAIVSGLTAGGLYVAIDGQTDGVVLLARASDREILEKFRDVVVAGAQAAGGNVDAVKEAEYKGFKAYDVNAKAKFVLLDDWLVVTNKGDLGKRVIENYASRTERVLASDATFQQARVNVGQQAAWAFINIHAIRESGVAPALYSGQAPNILAELILGGLLSNLQQTPFATLALQFSPDSLALTVASPHETSWSENREYYFGMQGQGVAPPLLDIPNRLFAASAYRDLSQMWLRAGDLMSEKANDQLAKADTQLTTFFSGKDFGEDILGAFTPGIQLIATQQSFDGVLPRPAIQLPAFAVQLQMESPEVTGRELRRVFQSFIGFLNVVGAMEGNPQFDLDMEVGENAQFVTATYVAPIDQRDSTSAAINFNFSPTLALTGDHFILASSTTLAKHLTQGLPPSNPTASEGPINTEAVLNVTNVSQVLAANQGQLVAQNMLEKGHTQQEAEGEIGLLLELLACINDARLSLKTEAGNLTLDLNLGLSVGDNSQSE